MNKQGDAGGGAERGNGKMRETDRERKREIETDRDRERGRELKIPNFNIQAYFDLTASPCYTITISIYKHAKGRDTHTEN